MASVYPYNTVQGSFCQYQKRQNRPLNASMGHNCRRSGRLCAIYCVIKSTQTAMVCVFC